MSDKEDEHSPASRDMRALCVGFGMMDGEVLVTVTAIRNDGRITVSMSPSTARVYADTLYAVAAEIDAIKEAVGKSVEEDAQ